MKSDEIDQIIAPPHSSRTATRCPKSLRVPRRNPEISDFFPASRTAEEVQLLHRNDQLLMAQMMAYDGVSCALV
ncbi:hypothetical protein E3N88_13712 [Mikania micrantha]|uniref:Uncharacterized protein n=1 Tax=Mikania micrantha TaxID=192012 RepID=A0A5N6NZQ7_9ASTR|nr:hypothetical protein E3N88_13712 [Mikania micrantha]